MVRPKLVMRKKRKQHVVIRSEKGEYIIENVYLTTRHRLVEQLLSELLLINVNNSTKNMRCGEDDNGRSVCPFRLERRLPVRKPEEKSRLESYQRQRWRRSRTFKPGRTFAFSLGPPTIR